MQEVQTEEKSGTAVAATGARNAQWWRVCQQIFTVVLPSLTDTLCRTYNVRKETPSMSSPPLPPSTPPYEQRERPADKIRITKAGKRNLRRMAEPEEYPWHRNIDFRKAREEADWDDSGYDQAVLDSMAATREQNRPYVQEQDDNLSEKQRR